MSNKLYDYLKWSATVGLPALTALYLALAHSWGWPYAEAIGATLAAVTACLCTLLGLSSVNYQKKLKSGNQV